MTHAENMMRNAIAVLQDHHATGSGFTLSNTTGTLGSFTGLVQDTSFNEVLAGGSIDDRTITIVAEIDQFTDAGVEPIAGMSVTHDSLRYVIESVTGRASDPTSYTIRAVAPMRPRK
jgi:hypothetical protein